MLKPSCLLAFLFSFFVGWSQQRPLEIPLNSSTVFKDASGQLISFETFLEQTSGRSYEMNPVFDENNQLKEVIVVKASVAEERTTMKPSQFANTVELIDRIPPDFEGTDLQGRFYDTESLKDKVLVLKFWFKACQPCIDEIPELNELVRAYRDNSEVVFLAPSLDKQAVIQSLLARQVFDYAIIPDARKIAHAYNVPGYPTHVVIGRNGKVSTVYLGVNHNIRQKLSRAIDYALNDREPFFEKNQTIPQQAATEKEEELFISPDSVIKNEEGERVPFPNFVELMSQHQYQLQAKKDQEGHSYILMKRVDH